MRIKEMAVARSSPIWKNKGMLKITDKMENRTQKSGQERAVRKTESGWAGQVYGIKSYKLLCIK